MFVNPDGTHWFRRADTAAYTSRDVLDAETRLLEHTADTSGARLPLRLVHRHTSRPIRDVKLADDQAAAILTLATSGRVLDVLVGPAGTGKTTARCRHEDDHLVVRQADDGRHRPAMVVDPHAP